MLEAGSSRFEVERDCPGESKTRPSPKGWNPRNKNIEPTLENRCEAQGVTARGADGVAGEEATEVDNVNDICEILSIHL